MAASAVMLMVLRAFCSVETAGSVDYVTSLRLLLQAVICGAVTYGVSLFLAWRLAGKPAGPEQTALALLGGRFARAMGGT
jgi:hypothetical protein